MKSMKSVKVFLFCVAAVLTVAFAVAVSKPYNAVSVGTGSDTNSNIISTENTAAFYDTLDLSESAQSATEEDSTNSESENETGFTVASNDEASTKSAATQNTEKSTVKSATPATSTTQNETTTRKPTATVPVQAEENENMTVYYTKTGERYHYANPCGKGTYYPTTLAEAKKMGLTPCQKCVLH